MIHNCDYIFIIVILTFYQLLPFCTFYKSVFLIVYSVHHFNVKRIRYVSILMSEWRYINFK